MINSLRLANLVYLLFVVIYILEAVSCTQPCYCSAGYGITPPLYCQLQIVYIISAGIIIMMLNHYVRRYYLHNKTDKPSRKSLRTEKVGE